MAEPDIDQLRQAQGLNPLPGHTPEPKPEPAANTVEDATIGNTELLRGIPAIGRVSGTMKGSRPGIDTVSDIEDEARELNHHGRLIARERMQQARANLRQPPPI